MKALKIILCGLGIIIGTVLTIGLAFLDRGPETYVYQARHIPKRYLKQIHKMELLEKDERIKYFYSDGLINIDEGMYFITDKNIVLYSKDWPEPKEIISFKDIANIEVQYSTSWIDDTWVMVGTDNYDYEFPLSKERDGDEKFVEYLQQQVSEDIPFTSYEVSANE
ncbi:hypothetical protein LNTAR_05526 [Lentisphaera araneosa HTCC2155]|jgi:hypothetical protein|uniref:Uncharacterized protein n=1 Tax=Lentisphaera araneosa HTCC2155 TaxID=313628 RepID=A6DLU2_9BACT|nr:hypothetical protein [Lentisphaera araneosa]EDM27547.1 hypothetical protein LNTAR_05526 [Lentisphaera araneosa HTCC2155]